MTLQDYQKRAIWRAFALAGVAILVMFVASQINNTLVMMAGYLLMVLGLFSLGRLLPRRKPPHVIARDLQEEARKMKGSHADVRGGEHG